jgi:hypothetical protein
VFYSRATQQEAVITPPVGQRSSPCSADQSDAVLIANTRPVDAIVFHHDLLGADDPKSFFRLQM